MYLVTKTYGHDLGLSATFRQWRAQSHCRFMHGYSMSFKLEFGCDKLDENGWVINFGALKPVKTYLENTFDHKTLVAKDDPAIEVWRSLSKDKSPGGQLIQLVEVERTGCEAFAKMVHSFVESNILSEEQYASRGVILRSVECREHGANSAVYVR